MYVNKLVAIFMTLLLICSPALAVDTATNPDQAAADLAAAQTGAAEAKAAAVTAAVAKQAALAKARELFPELLKLQKETGDKVDLIEAFPDLAT